MATFFLDLEGGNDANDGTTFANRWKTYTSGATAARIAPGDTIKVMASPDETLLGDATWTNLSQTVTLASAVTQSITDCGTVWTASTNVTSSVIGTRKQGSLAVSNAIASGFTTGLAAYFATGTLDLSGYQQVTFWMRTTTAYAASTLSLRLCSDAAGVTTVNTIALPPISSTNVWVPITVDTGGALGSSIQSIALYCDLDPGVLTLTLDNITAVKSAASADMLALTSIIAKVHTRCWQASTTYAANDIRKPTQPNRNGFCYRVTAGGGGSSGSSEPTWPFGIGATVSDGALTWTCEDIEESYHPVRSILGTTVILDGSISSEAANTTSRYQGATETVPTYVRQPAKLASMPVQSFNNNTQNFIQDSGTIASPITFSGGWDRTAMTDQNGETWVSGQNGYGNAINLNTKSSINLRNLNSVRFGSSIDISTGSTDGNVDIRNCHLNANDGIGVDASSGVGTKLYLQGVITNHCLQRGLYLFAWTPTIIAIGADSCGGGSPGMGINFGERTTRGNYIRVRGGAASGLGTASSDVRMDCRLYNLVTSNNAAGAINPGSNGLGGMTLVNAVIGEGTFVGTPGLNNPDAAVVSHKHQGVADSHLITLDAATITSATDQRHTASGISWKFRPTTTKRAITYPMRLSVAKLACASGVTVNVQIWVRRDNTNIAGRLIVPGGQIAGVRADIINTTDAPSVNTWTQSATVSFTPTEDGVVEVFYECWDGVGTSNNLWIDDLTVS